MTRLAILADIHGNLSALEAVIADMTQFAPEHVIVAGDLINGGLYDVEVMQRVHALNWTLIRGNHAFYFLDHHTEHEPDVRRYNPLYDHLYVSLADWFARLACMPDETCLHFPDGPPVRVMHGTPGNNRRAVTPLTSGAEIEAWLASVEETTFIAGHYHIAFERHHDRWHILNPGPVGMSQDGIRLAGYMLLDAAGDRWQATFRRVDYDFERLTHRYAQLKDRLGVTGYLAYLQIKYARPLINAFDDWYDAHKFDEPRSIELANRFLKSDQVWEYLGAKYQVNRDLMPDTFVLW